MIQDNPEIIQIINRLKVGMIDFIEPGESTYTKEDVDSCISIINTYLSNIEKSETKVEAMKTVEETVLLLNDLNEKCDYELIETGQREDIAEVIILAGNLLGYNSRDEDITEDWREW